MRNLEEDGYRELARRVQEWAAVHAPDWTDANDADPGVTLLQLFAFVTEWLEARGTVSEQARRSAARLAGAALSLARDPAKEGALARNNYFAGRLLGAEDFQLEQEYFRKRLRRLNRELHGSGIVRGLQVSMEPAGGGAEARVVVQPGFAIGPDGEEIEVRCPASAGLPVGADRLFVTIAAAERLIHPQPASDDQGVQFTRVQDTFTLRVAATVAGDSIALARLIQAGAGWTIDETFLAPRMACTR